MYWSNDDSAFDWLDKLGFKQSADFVHRHDGGSAGEVLMHVYRYDRLADGPTIARFANGMQLRAARFDGADLRADLLWETTEPLERDYVVSAKLLDASDALVGQQDSQPARSTADWEVGELVYSPHELNVITALPAGDLLFAVQVYYWDEGALVNVPTAGAETYAVIDTVRFSSED